MKIPGEEEIAAVALAAASYSALGLVSASAAALRVASLARFILGSLAFA